MLLTGTGRQAEGDRYFLTGVDAAVRAHAEAGLAPVFKYVIEQKPSIAFPAIVAGSLGNKELQHLPWGETVQETGRCNTCPGVRHCGKQGAVTPALGWCTVGNREL